MFLSIKINLLFPLVWSSRCTHFVDFRSWYLWIWLCYFYLYVILGNVQTKFWALLSSCLKDIYSEKKRKYVNLPTSNFFEPWRFSSFSSVKDGMEIALVWFWLDFFKVSTQNSICIILFQSWFWFLFLRW